MKPEADNLSYCNSVSQSDKNISRMVKLADDSNEPRKAFTEALINNALDKLEQMKAARERKISRWGKTTGWAAMFAAGCAAAFAVAVSALLKINFFLEALFVSTMFFNWIAYLVERRIL